MELRHLRYFVAVAETGAFSRAAARLRITQPALWRQVHDLEVELGVRLFERAGRRVRLTSEGEGLVRRSRELLAGVEQLAEHAHAVRSGEVGSLRVGASPQVIQSVLAPFLARYLKSRPSIDIHLVEEGGVRAAGLVERGEVLDRDGVGPKAHSLRDEPVNEARVLQAHVPASDLPRGWTSFFRYVGDGEQKGQLLTLRDRAPDRGFG